MLRFRIHDVRRGKTVFESDDLARVDAYWKRHHRRDRGNWRYQWKDVEAATGTRLAAGWSEPSARALRRIRASARADA